MGPSGNSKNLNNVNKDGRIRAVSPSDY